MPINQYTKLLLLSFFISHYRFHNYIARLVTFILSSLCIRTYPVSIVISYILFPLLIACTVSLLTGLVLLLKRNVPVPAAPFTFICCCAYI